MRHVLRFFHGKLHIFRIFDGKFLLFYLAERLPLTTPNEESIGRLNNYNRPHKVLHGQHSFMIIKSLLNWTPHAMEFYLVLWIHFE